MTLALDLKVTELLTSRICHDLISPVGAINNGVELLEEMGAQIGEEAVKLIGHSAEQAARRLRLFRLSYGGAGSDSNMTCDDVLGTMRDYLSGSRVSLSWKAETLKHIEQAPRGLAKVVLNLVMIAMENMVHGGTIEVINAGRSIKIMATGRAAGTRDEAFAPLKGDVAVDALTAKSVHPYITGKFAAYYGITLAWQQPAEDNLLMEAIFAA